VRNTQTRHRIDTPTKDLGRGDVRLGLERWERWKSEKGKKGEKVGKWKRREKVKKVKKEGGKVKKERR